MTTIDPRNMYVQKHIDEIRAFMLKANNRTFSGSNEVYQPMSYYAHRLLESYGLRMGNNIDRNATLPFFPYLGDDAELVHMVVMGVVSVESLTDYEANLLPSVCKDFAVIESSANRFNKVVSHSLPLSYTGDYAEYQEYTPDIRSSLVPLFSKYRRNKAITFSRFGSAARFMHLYQELGRNQIQASTLKIVTDENYCHMVANHFINDFPEIIALANEICYERGIHPGIDVEEGDLATTIIHVLHSTVDTEIDFMVCR